MNILKFNKSCSNKRHLCNNQIMNALDRGFVSSGFSHCPLLNLSCDWFNYMECVGNKGMEVRIFFYIC